MNWILATIISSIAFAGISLLLKKLTQYPLTPEILNFYFWITTSITFLAFALYKKSSFKISTDSLVWFLVLSIVAFVANYFSIIALKLAPNPGYVRAIQSANIIIITVSSIFLFGSTISIKMILGIMLILGGLYLLTS
jgi:drug/metabolite transporter (DMT)-like permease